MAMRTSLNKVEHSKRLEMFDDAYYRIMYVAESLKQLSVSSEQRTTTQSHALVALPVIKLPTFSGEIKGWFNYSNLFTTLTGDNRDLSNNHYLLFSHFQSPLIMSTLLGICMFKWYDKKWVIMASHVDALLQAHVATTGSAQSFLILLSAIIENVAALKTVNLSVDQWDMMLLHLLEKCMDQALRKKWELVVSELDIPTLNYFTDFHDKHCTSSKVLIGTSQNNSQLKSINNRKYCTSSGCLLLSPVQKSVCLCKGDRTIHRCSEFVQKDPQACFTMLKVKRLCINCLQAAHQMKSCPLPKSSQFCNACHNTDA
ncbi:hypothetical protein PR048_030919 [Dryococelus australis]|uniref:Uncharacterized protein n=1 Tax=Dryococelus australis TaxID=614101 RepID=A0ABQ9GA87_9NEOP|nr:hypothetical protein PR048_030919 [Dryococelus australis]